MKMTVFWVKVPDRWWGPLCRIDSANDNKFKQLECLLTDDGGTGVANSVLWIDECLKKIALIETGQLESYDWLREGWEADISGQEVIIFNGYEPENFDVLEIGKFKEILLAWQSFIQLPPPTEATIEIEI